MQVFYLYLFIAVSGNNGIASVQDVQNVEAYVNKVQAIREVLKRDHMKVAFFGRYLTSIKYIFLTNRKSLKINNIIIF